MSPSLIDRLRADGFEVAEGSGGAPPTARPADEAQLADLLARAAADGLRVVPTGSGSRLAWCRPEVVGDGVDLLLSLARLDDILEYVPGDGTITARAGCPWERLEATVAEGGHLLTPATAQPALATLGGTLAAGHSGLDRYRFGPLRHHVLGARVMLADGTLAQSGGRLVKNVAGFDLHRLYCGSRGTLCILLEASLRLFPAPERRLVLVTADESLERILERAASLHELALSPLALVVEGEPGAWRLHLHLAGLAPQVAWEREEARSLVPSAEELAGEEAHDAFRKLCAQEVEPAGWPQLVAGGRVRHLAETARLLLDAGADRLLLLPGVGISLAWIGGLAASEGSGSEQRLQSLASAAAERGARLEARALPARLHAALAPRLDSRRAFGWMTSLRQVLDPRGLLASPTFPGRS